MQLLDAAHVSESACKTMTRDSRMWLKDYFWKRAILLQRFPRGDLIPVNAARLLLDKCTWTWRHQ
jgi:hypothetical protein